MCCCCSFFSIDKVFQLYRLSTCLGHTVTVVQRLGFFVFEVLSEFYVNWHICFSEENFRCSWRCFSTIGDSVQSTPQGFHVSAHIVPSRIKFKGLIKLQYISIYYACTTSTLTIGHLINESLLCLWESQSFADCRKGGG